MRKKIINCLNNELVSIYKQTIRLQELEKTLKKYLPPHLENEVSVASFDKGTLKIVLKKAEFANELRYLIPELRTALRHDEALFSLVSIKQIVRPS